MKISNLMTTDLLTVGPYTPILSAVEILVHKRFNGLPVVDKNMKLLGLLTQHDMMLRGTDIHLPTLIHILTDVKTYGRDKGFMNGEMQSIAQTKTSDIMNANPLTLSPDDPVDAALKIFAERHDVNPIPVVDDAGILVGIMSRYDMIKLFGEKTTKEVELDAADRDIDNYLRETLPRFQNSFLFVRRLRTKHWLIVSVGSFVVGFMAAVLFMIVITPE